MFKYLLLKTIFDLSDVDIVERSKYDMSFKYFLDMTPEEDVINSSSLTKFRKLHWKYLKEQIAELKRAVAVKMPMEDILEFFYPEASTQQMREIVDTFHVLN
jgi:hypothetical protein